jgi:hypothetical protein
MAAGQELFDQIERKGSVTAGRLSFSGAQQTATPPGLPWRGWPPEGGLEAQRIVRMREQMEHRTTRFRPQGSGSGGGFLGSLA